VKESPLKIVNNIRKKHKWVLPVLIIAIVIVLVLVIMNGMAPKRNFNSMATAATGELEKTSIASTVSATGKLLDQRERNVSTTQSTRKIESIEVKDGQQVHEGDILATLNTDELNDSLKTADVQTRTAANSLEEQKTTLANSLESARLQVVSAENKYNNAKRLYEQYKSDPNQELSVQSAQLTLNDAIAKQNEVNNDTVLNAANAAVSAAQSAADQLKEAYNACILAADELDAISQPTAIAECNTNVTYGSAAQNAASATLQSAKSTQQVAQASHNQNAASAQQTRDKAQNAYDVAVKNANDQKESAANSLRDAENSLNSARVSYSAAESKTTNSQLLSLESSKISLNKAKRNLAEAVVKAPTDGTITLVNCKIGDTASGTLFVLDSVRSLKVEAELGEFDISNIKQGQRVKISTDATGDDEFVGEVTEVGMTSTSSVPSTSSTTSSSSGSTASSTSSTPKYKVSIAVNTYDERMRIGMTARVSITTQEKNNVFSVPFDAVKTNDKGVAQIFVVEGEGEEARTRPVQVTTGIENDTNTEITGAALKEGLKYVLSTAEASDSIGSLRGGAMMGGAGGMGAVGGGASGGGTRGL
jgi:multidrug efflux pump subunit AcrA (membrane-fusion protein)